MCTSAMNGMYAVLDRCVPLLTRWSQGRILYWGQILPLPSLVPDRHPQQLCSRYELLPLAWCSATSLASNPAPVFPSPAAHQVMRASISPALCFPISLPFPFLLSSFPYLLPHKSMCAWEKDEWRRGAAVSVLETGRQTNRQLGRCLPYALLFPTKQKYPYKSFIRFICLYSVSLSQALQRTASLLCLYSVQSNGHFQLSPNTNIYY